MLPVYILRALQSDLHHRVEDVEIRNPDAMPLVIPQYSVRAAGVVLGVVEAHEPRVVPGHDDGRVERHGHLEVVHVRLRGRVYAISSQTRGAP